MTYNLTEKQKDLARWIASVVKEGTLTETFQVLFGPRLYCRSDGQGDLEGPDVDPNMMQCLANCDLVVVGRGWTTVTAKLFAAVSSNFAEEPAPAPISILAQPHPPEIAMSLDRFRERFPDPKKVGFLIMRFAAEKPYATIVEAIKKTAEQYGLQIVRADEREFHRNLLNNVRTYLHGCGFGIAIYERITTDEPNANVGLEVGYLMAMNKPILLLKDKTVETLQTDLAGELYKEFDPHDPEGTIPAQLTKWLEDYGIIVPKRTAIPENSPAL